MDDQLAQRMDAALHARSAVVREGANEAGTLFSIARVDAGKLTLPTGRLCIADIYSADEFPALNRIVLPGEYPAQIVVAELPRDLPFGNKRAAFVVVKCSDHAPASWEPITAIAPADPCFLDEQPNGFVQEGATGLFSPEAGEVHFRTLYANFDERASQIQQQERGERMYKWCNFTPEGASANVIMCKGGFGDGTYLCFVGIDARGRVTHFVVDFGIVGP